MFALFFNDKMLLPSVESCKLGTLKESKSLFQQRNSTKLLHVLEEMPKRDGADVFFSFPGTSKSVGI